MYKIVMMMVLWCDTTIHWYPLLPGAPNSPDHPPFTSSPSGPEHPSSQLWSIIIWCHGVCDGASWPQLRYERLSWVNTETSVGWAGFVKTKLTEASITWFYLPHVFRNNLWYTHISFKPELCDGASWLCLLFCHRWHPDNGPALLSPVWAHNV